MIAIAGPSPLATRALPRPKSEIVFSSTGGDGDNGSGDLPAWKKALAEKRRKEQDVSRSVISHAYTHTYTLDIHKAHVVTHIHTSVHLQLCDISKISVNLSVNLVVSVPPTATNPVQAKAAAEKDQREAEEAKWAGVPVWKRKLMEEKEKKAVEERAPEEMKAMEREAKVAQIHAMPEWKRNLVLKK